MAEQRPDRPLRKPARTGNANGGGDAARVAGLLGGFSSIGLAIMLIALFQMKNKQYVQPFPTANL